MTPRPRSTCVTTRLQTPVVDAKYLAHGGPSRYGLPTTDVMNVVGGAYTHFSGARSIFWSPTTKAHLVYGPILTKYASVGYFRSCLRFPTTDRFASPRGFRNDFTGGHIVYVTRTRRAVATC